MVVTQGTTTLRPSHSGTEGPPRCRFDKRLTTRSAIGFFGSRLCAANGHIQRLGTLRVWRYFVHVKLSYRRQSIAPKSLPTIDGLSRFTDATADVRHAHRLRSGSRPPEQNRASAGPGSCSVLHELGQGIDLPSVLPLVQNRAPAQCQARASRREY